MQLNWKKIGFHAAVILAFLLIAFAYASPELEGKTVLGHDTESWAYSAQEARQHNKTHETPTLWTNSMFGGMPTYQITMPPSYNIIEQAHRFLQKLPMTVFFIFLYLTCFYIASLCFGLRSFSAIASALAFTFASYNFIIIAAGHNSKVATIAYMAPLVGAVFLAFRKNKYVGALLTTVFLSLAILANHVQILYYTIFILFALAVSEFYFYFKEKKLKAYFKTVGLLIFAAILAIGMNATRLLTTLEYSHYTMRGASNGLTLTQSGTQKGLDKDYITQWSYGVDESLTLLVPNFMGGASSSKLGANSATAARLQTLGVRDIEKTMAQFPLPTYWGTQPFTSGAVYFGAVILFLALLGAQVLNGRTKWWLIAVSILMLMLSWGRNFMLFTEFFIDFVPMYNKFRTVSMTLVATGFCWTLLAVLGLKAFIEDEILTQKKLRALYISAGVTAGVALLLAIFPSLAGDFVAPSDSAQFTGNYAFLRETLPLDRAQMLKADAWRSFLFIALAAAVLFSFVKFNFKKKTIIYLSFAILIFADLYPICKRYLNDENFVRKNAFNIAKKPSTADKFILQDETYFRVLDASTNIFNDASPAFFHKNIGGYHAAKLRRYQELIDVHLGAEIQRALSAQSADEIVQKLHSCNALNMLNTKYLIYNKEALPIENPSAFGAAWFVENFKIAHSADEEMTLLGTENLRKTLVVDEEFAQFLAPISPDSLAKISLKSYEPNRLIYNTFANSAQLAVFSEIFYDKGWNAFVDGKPAPYFRANYLLRAMQIPAGEHEIEFRFEPRSFEIGNALAIGSSALFLILLCAAIFYFKKKGIFFV